MAKETHLQWLERHADYSGENCLIWPFSRDPNGYGRVGRKRKILWAHRVMCELKHGPCPPGHEASHSCGNGKGGCIHPSHISWKTRSQNQRDRRKHGTHGNGKGGKGTRWKLTPEKVSEIRALAGKVPQAQLALIYGTSWQNIGMIVRGEIWKTGQYNTGNEARAIKRAALP